MSNVYNTSAFSYISIFPKLKYQSHRLRQKAFAFKITILSKQFEFSEI